MKFLVDYIVKIKSVHQSPFKRINKSLVTQTPQRTLLLKPTSTTTTTTTSPHSTTSTPSTTIDTASPIVDMRDLYANSIGGDPITIIHFNDCYNIEPGPFSSGAAGFLTAINQHRHLNPMILFSGDIISPSFMSTFTKGEQMIPVLNDIKVDCAVFGNHEFDYGVDNLIDFVKRTTFPWLLSNVIDKETSNQLGDGQVFHIMERSGIKFGLIGLIEEEWLSTLSTLDSSDVIYEDFVVRGRELARWLKSSPHNVDYVIALTHFRTPNDIRLADSVPEIDLILGGHDHDYEVIKRPNCYIIKSGTDFREFSKITLKICTQELLEFREKKIRVASEDNSSISTEDANEPPHARPTNPRLASPSTISLPLDLDVEHIKCLGYDADNELKAKLDRFVTSIDEKMGKVLGQFNCELDGRFSSIRKFETNLGNFVTDIMLASTHADLAILNSGTLRSDRIHPRGNFTMRDLFNILGYIDPIAVLQATGEHIWRALENGVSQWPKLEGRFPQVSGCTFTFDPSKPPMQRINPKDIYIGDEQLVIDKQYRLTTKAYLASGKDGYDMLKECSILVPGDESPDLTTSILNHFEAINIVKSNRRTHHRQSIICLSRTSLKKILDSQSSTSMSGTVGASPASNCCSPTPSNNLTLTHAETNKNSTGEERHQCQQSNDDNNNNKNSKNTIPKSVSSSSPQTVTENEIVDTFGDDLSPWCNGRSIRGDSSAVASALSSPIVGTQMSTPNWCYTTETDQATSTTPATPITNFQPRQQRTKRIMSLYEMEHEQCKLEPKVEGRIRIYGVNA